MGSQCWWPRTSRPLRSIFVELERTGRSSLSWRSWQPIQKLSYQPPTDTQKPQTDADKVVNALISRKFAPSKIFGEDGEVATFAVTSSNRATDRTQLLHEERDVGLVTRRCEFTRPSQLERSSTASRDLLSATCSKVLDSNNSA